MKGLVIRAEGEQSAYDGVERLTRRYQVAHAVYQFVADRNTELMLSGGKPSELAHIEEERAFEELDVARHALLVAAERAYPTIH